MSFLKSFASFLSPSPAATPATHAADIRAGTTLLVDVREPDECARGVAESAALLPLSDLRGLRKQWAPFLASAGQRTIVLYCASGMRSGLAARMLAGDGFRALNGGGLGDWSDAGWPIVPPRSASKTHKPAHP